LPPLDDELPSPWSSRPKTINPNPRTHAPWLVPTSQGRETIPDRAFIIPNPGNTKEGTGRSGKALSMPAPPRETQTLTRGKFFRASVSLQLTFVFQEQETKSHAHRGANISPGQGPRTLGLP
jgi:hypothetical protein